MKTIFALQKLARISQERDIEFFHQNKSNGVFYDGLRYNDEKSLGIDVVWRIEIKDERTMISWLTWWKEEGPLDMADILIEDISQCVETYC